MSFKTKGFGGVIGIIGLVVWYIDALIIKAIFEGGSYIADVVNAPESAALIISVLIVVFMLSIIVLLLCIGGWLLLQGANIWCNEE